jgi:hypothetical protein
VALDAEEPDGVSDASGTIVLRDLPAGLVRVEVTAPDGRTGTTKLRCMTGRAAVGTVALR